MTIKNKVIIITGAGSGLGRELAIGLSREEGKIIALGRRIDKIEETVSLCSNPQRHMAIQCDITEDSDIDRMIELVISKHHSIDILINNAALSISGDLQNLQTDDIKKVITTNLTSPIILTKKISSHIEKSESGAIINIGSMACYWAVPFHSVYTSAKFGIAGFSKSLMAQYRNTNIQVFLAYPGGMKSEMISDSLEKDAEKLGLKVSHPSYNSGIIIKGLKKNKQIIYAQTVLDRITGHLFTKHFLFRNIMYKKYKQMFKTAAYNSNLHTEKSLYR